MLVIEPRRIACRSLAQRVAELDGSELGKVVGYLVRDDARASATTRIVYATPGLVLRNRAVLDSAACVILDEFHERSLDTDLLLALLLRRPRARLVIMSATLDGERIARHVAGQHLVAEGKTYEVAMRYLPEGEVMPHAKTLAGRVQSALTAAAKDPGDVLVFLPGKAEIEACMQSLRGSYRCVPLHGGLSLNEQRRAFEPHTGGPRKVVLATNVAETSLTIPGIGVVIDCGLVRRTHYHEGRSYLALAPIASDSAAQRAGRAGRTGPGVCYRLWNSLAQLAPATLPEIHRESLVPLVLTVAAWGEEVEALPWLDPAKPYALEAARTELQALGALRDAAALSDTGQQLFALPLPPGQAQLLLHAREHACLDDMIDLVAVLSVGRPVFGLVPGDLSPDDDLRAAGCDGSAAIRALRAKDPAQHGAVPFVIHEARAARARLRRLMGLPENAPYPSEIRRDALLTAALAGDPRLCHVARARGRDRYFSNGGTELELARESAALRSPKLEAVLALETRALGAGRDARVLITCAMPLPVGMLARAGLGSDRLGAVTLERKRVSATVERVYAQRVIAERQETPSGELARAAFLELLMRGSLFRQAVATTRERLARTELAAALAQRAHYSAVAAQKSASTPSVEAWLSERLETLGVTSGDDLPLLSEKDFIAPDVSYELRAQLDERFPSTVSVGDATYRVEYDIARGQVLLHMVKGSRREPPPLAYLPKFEGLRISVVGPRGTTILR